MSSWRNLQSLKDCGSGRCGLPPGLFRLRYFHGKQMRLADYMDEQRYHMGKMRYHNEKLHGAGILCGLGVSLLDELDGVVLRVARGAALDDCGREIVVGYDQCIDVASWFEEQEYETLNTVQNQCEPEQENTVRICVLISYAECAGAPEPAPRSPCAPPSCGETFPCPDPCGEGAEFGRVTEEFELRLMLWEEAKPLIDHKLFPTTGEIDTAVAQASGGVGLLTSLAEPIRARCPGADKGWLLLACFDAVLGDGNQPEIVAIRDIDHECASQVLLSTEVIQYLLAGLIADMDPDIGGPEIQKIDFRKVGNTNYYQFILELTGEIEKASLDEDASFGLRRLTSTGWRTPGSNAVTADYATKASKDFSVNGPAIYISVDNNAEFLKPGGRYQLFIPPAAEPVVDENLRSLRPRHLVWRFGIEDGNGTLDMVTLPNEPCAS